MAVTIMCPNLQCRKVLMVPTKMRGKRVRCAYCGTILSVPSSKGKNPTSQAKPALAAVSADDQEKQNKK